MASRNLHLLSILFGFLFFKTISCTICVPTIVWQSSSDSAEKLSSISVVQRLTSDEFMNDCLKKLKIDGPTILFSQKQLSLEDFTMYGNAHNQSDEKSSFVNLQSALSNNPAVMLPCVEMPEQSLLEFFKGKKIYELEPTSKIPTDAEDAVLVFRLTSSEKNRQSTLASNDQLMGKILKEVSKQYPSLTAVYTGDQNPWPESNGIEKHRKSKRHILAAPTESDQPNVYFNVSNCFLLYFENVTVYHYQQNTTQKTITYDVDSQMLNGTYSADLISSCGQNVTSVQVTYTPKNSPKVMALTFTMDFELKARNDWYMTLMTVESSMDINGQTVNNSNPLQTSSVWAPLGFSYHCNGANFQYDRYNSNQTNWTEITFSNFQIQPFIGNSSTGGFGDPWDCVGFFTIGIWMAIFIIAVLIIILGFGIYITFIIKTMDRFDDPKGKSISVGNID